jgi:hypothetical protein
MAELDNSYWGYHQKNFWRPKDFLHHKNLVIYIIYALQKKKKKKKETTSPYSN